MGRSFDPKKVALWQRRFRRFSDSGLAVTRLCAVEDVSESSFYYWQKKLGPQTRRRSARAEHHGTRAKNHDTGAEDCRARTEHHDTRSQNHGTRAENHDVGAEDRGVFQRVTVMPDTGGVVIRLPGGTRIEVEAHHLYAIRAVVAETVRVDQSQAAERNVSCDNQVTPQESFDNQFSRNKSCENQATRKASSDNQVTRNISCDNQFARNESSENQATRNVSCETQVTRNVSSDNQATRKASSHNQVTRQRGTISKRDGTLRKRGDGVLTRDGVASC